MSAPAWDLFSQAAQETDKGRAKAASRHALDIQMLTPLTLELARAAREFGITVADLRDEAERRGMFKKGLNTRDRSLSYLSSVPPAAGLVKTGGRRYSPRNRNSNAVWILPELAR